MNKTATTYLRMLLLLTALALLLGSAAGQAFETPATDITFTMPEDGHVAMIIKNADGVVVRQLLNSELKTKGDHTATWDGLTNPIWKTPGVPVEPGEYTWSAIYHTGIGLRLRGWAYHGPSDPWDISHTSYWGGDHALPVACAADNSKVYLGWAGAEAGKALVACDMTDNVVWGAGYYFNGVVRIAIGSDQVAGIIRPIIYYVKGKSIRRVDTRTGSHMSWSGHDSMDLPITKIWGDRKGLPTKLALGTDGFSARNKKLYFSFSEWTWDRRDITDWRAFLSKVQAGAQPGPEADPVGQAIWKKMDDRSRKTTTDWLKGDKPEDEALKSPAYWISDVRDVAIRALRSLLDDKTLVEGAEELSRDKLREMNRRVVEKTYPDETVKMTSNFVAVVGAHKGKLVKIIDVEAPGRMVAVSDDLIYLFSKRTRLLALNPETGNTRVILEGLKNPGALAVDKHGDIYVALSRPDNQVQVYSPQGELLRTIGKNGGRVRKGPWDPSGMSNIWGMAVDARGRLWVAETDVVPKRFSVWDAKTGEFLKEFLGPTHYGAGGGAINPRDPDLMVGEGCEFRLDPKTGRDTLIGIVTQEVYHKAARFCQGANGRLYLAATYKGFVWGPGEPHQIRIFERLGDGRYAYRAVIRSEKDKTSFWADENGDEEEQPEEVASLPVKLDVGGYNLWSININTDLTFYGGHKEKALQIKVGGFTKCGAPKFDLENAKELPPMTGGLLSSPDNRLVVSCDAGDSLFRCHEVATGKLLWTYPNTFHGVHGSHRAPGPAVGLIRGAFGFVGNAHFPKPVGALWAINTNLGEWHVLTEDGYYLTRIFQGDQFKHKWPEKAVPGAVMDDCPSGLGGEDFGGSMIQGNDGKLYVQAGKLALWNVEVVGLQNVKPLEGGKLTITPAHVLHAEVARGRARQAEAEPKSLAVKMMTPAFTGNIDRDFKGATILKYQKRKDAAVRSAAAWDADNLYLAWDVKDNTPWANGSDAPHYMYTSGDTVDFQLGTNPAADKSRTGPAEGDIRLSVGTFHGKPTAVLYNMAPREAGRKNSTTFASGVVAEYAIESPRVLEAARIEVKTSQSGYVVEAAIPLEALGLKITNGMKLLGDFGVTHSAPNGRDTVLRTYWSNQATGIVNDDVFELRVEPANWGELTFEDPAAAQSQ